MKKKKKTLAKYKAELDAYCREFYYLPAAEMIGHENAIKNAYDNGDTPKELADHYAEKYDLVKKQGFIL